MSAETVAPPSAVARFGAGVKSFVGRPRSARLGVIYLLILVILALAPSVIAPFGTTEADASAILQAPSLRHPMGTDHLGRDVFSRVIYGGRLSLLVGIVSSLAGSVIGGSIGLLSGYIGGRVGGLAMRIMEVLLAFPGILLALTIVAITGPSLAALMVAIAVSSFPIYARIMWAQTLAIKERPFVEAARASGVGHAGVILRHIIPNTVSALIVMVTLGIALAILAAATLSFLGLGPQPPTPEWGVMVAEGRNYLRSAWWITTFPGLAITLTVLAVNAVGEHLRTSLDPRRRLS